MATQIDHIVIAVRDLDAASRDFASVGFTVLPGGEHVAGTTHNALVTFQDGSYFELIAFKSNDRAPDPPHRWWEKLARGEGLVDYAVLSSDLAAEAATIRERGIEATGPFDGGRIRPDGQRLAWRTLLMTGPEKDMGLPFMIDDRTSRPLRVPGDTSSVHPGRFEGVTGLTIVVSDLDEAASAYAALLGHDGAPVDPEIAGGNAARRFLVGKHWIDLVEPDTRASVLRSHLESRGDGPFEVTLRGGMAGMLPEAPTHGSRIRVEE